MTQITKRDVDFHAFLTAGSRVPDLIMEFAVPYGQYLKRSEKYNDDECSHCLGKARDLLRKIEKAANVSIVNRDLSLEDMGAVITIMDQEAHALSLSKAVK